MPDVVVVESPAKAKTINKYLGDGFTVLASFGHVRDLPPKDGSVRPDQDFAMDWEADDRGSKQIAAIAKAMKGADTLYLATDPDREGEAISWHVRAMLDERHALRGKTVHRITFNEVTKTAVRFAMDHPRDLDVPLIEAYLARRALDYLVGFTLSPVLWRKLPGSKSAGRVQSVALRLIAEREAEIEDFRPREYWTIEAGLVTPKGAPFAARLTHLDGKRLDQFDLPDAATAARAKAAVEAAAFAVASVERRRVKRNPPAPFTTSTLQQEASRKLGFGAQQTMRVAQQLYEGVDIGGETAGLITYMRTDGVQISRDAIETFRSHVREAYGPGYVPDRPREYATKAKNAQEAHEAVRPTDVSRTPESVARHLDPDQRRLYDLVWKRSVGEPDAVRGTRPGHHRDRRPEAAERAEAARQRFHRRLRRVPQAVSRGTRRRRRRGRGPHAAGHERARSPGAARGGDRHPALHPAAAALLGGEPGQEDGGAGDRPPVPPTRPSWAVLTKREYARLENRRFVPEDRGRLVTAFLTSFFERYVDTGFTAGLEEQLDDISGGRAEWRAVMHAFWRDFSHAIEQTRELKISDVIDALDKDLGAHFFPARADGGDPRLCPSCHAGRLGLRLGRHGSFIGCSNYPTCQYTRQMAIATGEGDAETLKEGTRNLGRHPETGEDVTVRRGPYGLYVQQGEQEKDAKRKPRRTSLPRGVDGATIELEQALALLSLPRIVGIHPETREPIEAGIGRFGPFVKMGPVFASLEAGDDVLVVGMNRAVDLLAKKLAGVRALGAHPADKEPVFVRRGRFGPYAQHGNRVANLPRDVLMDDVTLDSAVALLAERGKVVVAKGRKGKPAPKAPAAKAPAAKAPRCQGARCQGARCQGKGRRSTRNSQAGHREGRATAQGEGQAEEGGPQGEGARREGGREEGGKLTVARRPTGGLPSREEVRRFIRDAPGRVGKREVALAFRVGPEHRSALRDMLRELGAAGEVAPAGHRRFEKPGRLPDSAIVQVTGTDRDGEAIARPVEWKGEGPPPLVLMAAEPRGRPALAPGERVLAKLRAIGPGRYEGRTLKRLSDSPGRIIGVYRPGHERGGAGRIVPTDRRAKAEWIVPPGEEAGAEAGEIVSAEPLPGSGLGLRPARVVERLGRMGDARSVSLIVIATHDIPTEFPPAALAQAARARGVSERGRTDLRQLPLVTIDGADARDFDDAVFAEPAEDGHRLVVAIADVAHYVRPATALDREAERRGNSCYFPDRVVPMLPEALSNGWCSLRPNEDRGCLFVEMTIDRSGRKTAHRFGRGLMRSAARLTYGAVEENRTRHPELYAAYGALIGARLARGTLDLDLPERRVVLDDQGRVASVAPRPRLDSHRLIEEFMVLANVCAAEELERLARPCMYRVHPPPSDEKLENLRLFLRQFDISLPPGNAVHPRDLDRVLRHVAGTEAAPLVNEVMLRSQSQASYSPDNLGHFGLALSRYAHFTSPIRRYADLLVHRALVAGLRLGPGALSDDEAARFPDIAEGITATERRAALAERDAIDRYLAAFMADKVGQHFPARISGVQKFGLFVTILGNGASGLVPVGSLPDDFWMHDETAQTLTGRRTGMTFRLAQEAEVRLAEASPVTGGLIFQMLVDRAAPRRAAAPTRGTKRR